MAAKTIPQVTTIAITDRDTIAAVAIFKEASEYASFAESVDKLIARATRLNLHHMTNAQFEDLIRQVSNS